jgi:hypothetical protein
MQFFQSIILNTNNFVLGILHKAYKVFDLSFYLKMYPKSNNESLQTVKDKQKMIYILNVELTF